MPDKQAELEDSGNLLTVGELAAKCLVSKSVIKYYLRAGILPSRLGPQPKNKYHLFGPREVEILETILAERRKGKSVAAVEDTLRLQGILGTPDRDE